MSLLIPDGETSRKAAREVAPRREPCKLRRGAKKRLKVLGVMFGFLWDFNDAGSSGVLCLANLSTDEGVLDGKAMLSRQQWQGELRVGSMIRVEGWGGEVDFAGKGHW